MTQCPVCNSPGAYIGFATIECRNPDCEHFVLFEEEVCPCCGKVDHCPEPVGVDVNQNAQSGGAAYIDYSDPTSEVNSGGDDASHCPQP